MTASHLKIVFSYCLYFLVSNNILYLSIRLELKLSKHWAGPSQGLKICPPGWDRVNCSAKKPSAPLLQQPCIELILFLYWYISILGWAPWNLSCLEFRFDDTRLSYWHKNKIGRIEIVFCCFLTCPVGWVSKTETGRQGRKLAKSGSNKFEFQTT